MSKTARIRGPRISIKKAGNLFPGGSMSSFVVHPAIQSVLVVAFILLASGLCVAEGEVKITSDTLEYLSEQRLYIAAGSVSIERDGAVVHADKATYNETTSEITAEGNVRFEDKETSMKARRVELNMESKTGRLYDAEIFSKLDHTYISGGEIEKRGEGIYYSPSASFTTCDPPSPAWCFSGRSVDVLSGDRLKAAHVTFAIKGLPVLYTPYFRVPLLKERQSGLLTPSISFSSSRGTGFNVPLYWVISENRDATIVLDSYSKRGLGTGLEYRFVAPGVEGNWWLYHIRDSELDTDFWEIVSRYDRRRADKPGGFLNINYINEREFYTEFSPAFDLRTAHFLESTGEVNVPFDNSRLYLLSQYWVDLQGETSSVGQRLPEAGFVLHPTRAGDFMFEADVSASNFWREEGVSAGRVDLYPKVRHSFGRDFVFTQEASARATSYVYYGDKDDSLLRTAAEYEVSGKTRLFRSYGSVTHLIEPSLGYHFITSSENDLDVLDSSELFQKTSSFELSLLSSFFSQGKEILLFRITQGVETYEGDRPLLPLRVDLGLKTPIVATAEATYDFNDRGLNTVSSDVQIPVYNNFFISIGERYNRQEEIMKYMASVSFSPLKEVQINGWAIYDQRGEGLTDYSVSLNYLRQCWGISISALKSPDDFTLAIAIELTGVTRLPVLGGGSPFSRASSDTSYGARRW